MKNFIFIISVIMMIFSFSSCTNPVNDVDETELHTYGLFPSDNNTFTIFASKSKYISDSYDYIDSLLFIKIDSTGNKLGQYGFSIPFRPYIQQVFLLNNGNIMIFGNISSYYSSGSIFEASLTGAVLWEFEVPNGIYGASPSRDGNVFLFGGQYNNDQYESNYQDLLCTKMSRSGDTLWTKILDISLRENFTTGIPTADNGCIALGTVWVEDRSTDMFATRFTETGDTMWTGSYGGDRYDNLNFATELSDGSYLLTGELNLYDSTNADWNFSTGQQVYLIKVTANGETEWTRAIGNSLREHPNAIIEVSDGGFILLGTRDQSFAYLFDETIGWINKISSNGDILWEQEFESILPSGVYEISTGELLVIASNTISSWQYGPNMNLIKLSSSGTILWNRVLTP